jgi:heme-degrading monooxygenase HmoA
MKSTIRRGPPEPHLHGIFMEPRPSGMGKRRRLRSALPANWSGRTGGAGQRPDHEHQLMEERMFVAIARFPEVPTEREAEFRAWFAWSNDHLRDIDGLEVRRLLRAPDGSYTVLVEHKSAETFAAMHTTDVATQVHARLAGLLINEPAATMYEVVADLANFGSCCGGASGHGGQRKHNLAVVGAGDKAQTASGCCR